MQALFSATPDADWAWALDAEGVNFATHPRLNATAFLGRCLSPETGPAKVIIGHARTRTALNFASLFSYVLT